MSDFYDARLLEGMDDTNPTPAPSTAPDEWADLRAKAEAAPPFNPVATAMTTLRLLDELAAARAGAGDSDRSEAARRSVGWFGLQVCTRLHGGEGNAATVYGHHGSMRTCIRVRETDEWVYDPAWEEPR